MNGIWIPQEIWLLDDLSPMQRILLSKIHALSHKDGSCWAGDDFLAESLGYLLNTSARCARNFARPHTSNVKGMVTEGR